MNYIKTLANIEKISENSVKILGICECRLEKIKHEKKVKDVSAKLEEQRYSYNEVVFV